MDKEKRKQVKLLRDVLYYITILESVCVGAWVCVRGRDLNKLCCLSRITEARKNKST